MRAGKRLHKGASPLALLYDDGLVAHVTGLYQVGATAPKGDIACGLCCAGGRRNGIAEPPSEPKNQATCLAAYAARDHDQAVGVFDQRRKVANGGIRIEFSFVPRRTPCLNDIEI
jgi:hypothetical protein